MLNRILIALDSAKNPQPVFSTALAWAKINKSRLLLLNVLSQSEHAKKDSAEWESHRVSDLEELRSLSHVANNLGLMADLAQPLGRTGQKICELANRWGADLIILGQPDSVAEEDVLNDIGHYVIHHASCPTLVVPYQRDQVFASNSDAIAEHYAARKPVAVGAV
ncbi:MAG: universal stress protein [Phormidesmis sp. CAN_BIN36]|nr:universal stress protein [Phormidesmis sp. CAN_BIN36]